MNYLDFIILYLTCGAPFSVEYFLRRRNSLTFKKRFLKTFLILLFWLPYSFRALGRFVKKRKKIRLNFFPVKEAVFFDEKRIQNIQKKMENLSLFTNQKYSLFEFRDLYNRYKGLVLESQIESKVPSDAEQEFFIVSSGSNSNVSAICLHRRNQFRLSNHLKKAREDFLAFLNEIFQTEFQYDKACLILQIFDLAVLLNDLEMQSKLQQNFTVIFPDNANSAANFDQRELLKKETRPELQTN
jgi:hypothetical protein